MNLVPYWSDTARPLRGGEEASVEGSPDVVSVGGGFTGLSAALNNGLSLATSGAPSRGSGSTSRATVAGVDMVERIACGFRRCANIKLAARRAVTTCSRLPARS